MKLDKETLQKHRFWIVLGVIAFLMLIATSWLGTGVADELGEVKDAITKHKAELSLSVDRGNANQLKGKEEMRVLDDKRSKLEVRRGGVWDEAWKAQNPEADPLIVWPELVRKKKDLFELSYGDTANVDSNLVLEYVRKESYHTQFDDGKFGGIVNMFKVEVPGDKAGDKKVLEPIQLRDEWKKMLRYVTWNDHPTTEEMWLAQEDFWVNRELLRAIKAANYSVSHFTPVEGDQKPEVEGGFARKVFKNRYWQLDLTLTRKGGNFGLAYRLTNISDRRQSLGQAYFKVRVNEKSPDPILVEVQSDPLGVGETWPAKGFIEKPLDTANRANPDGIFDVEQVWDPQTSPVRRIDQIALFAQSHRTFDPALQKLKKEGFATGPAAAVPEGGGDKGPEAGFEKTENGLVRTRYFDATDQVRRLPVGVVLIVDQAHVPEVLTALANSHLRFQTTQVNLQHFFGSLAKPKDDGKTPAPEDAQANNLMEVSIYGIASLYDRPTKKTEVKKEVPKKEVPKKDGADAPK